MKVKCLREMPFAKVSDIITLDEYGQWWIETGATESCYNKPAVLKMIADGWIEEIKKESLEDKIYNYLETQPPYISQKKLAQIAKDHCLKAFDKYIGQYPVSYNVTMVELLRDAIDQA